MGNVVINFRQSERTRILENNIYNELLIRGYTVGNRYYSCYHEEIFKTTIITYKIYFCCDKN